MYFASRQTRLLDRIREMVRCGELTERGLGRATGVSQPQVHNVLKGVRSFSTEFADQILHELGLTLADLSPDPYGSMEESQFPAFQPVPVLRGRTGQGHFPFTPEYHDGVHPFPRNQTAPLTDPVVVMLHAERSMAPLCRDGDLVLLERAEQSRLHPDPESVYIVETSTGTSVRYIRCGGRSLYLLTEQSIKEPRDWDYLSLVGRNILEIVRGRIVWMGRKMETIPAGPPRQTG
jgi:hypothetical protein